MAETDSFDETCETCAYLTGEDACGNPESVYFRRPMVYRDGEDVLQTGWCEHWARHGES